jgi:hypothetical protein
LATFDRHVAECKDRCREAVLWLSELTRVRDTDGRCYTAILEAIDDMVAAKRDAIRARLEEADIAIEDAERAA